MRLACDCGPQVYGIKTLAQWLAMLDRKLLASLLAILPDSHNVCVKGHALGSLSRGELFPSLRRELNNLLSVLWLLPASSGSHSERGSVAVDHFGAQMSGYGMSRKGGGGVCVPSYYLVMPYCRRNEREEGAGVFTFNSPVHIVS